MARLARVVIPGIPHYITQRGNRQQQVFSSDDDYQLYLDLVAAGCARAGVEVLAYCLMPGHVQLIAVPQDEDGLRAAIADAHRRFARQINARDEATGHLWQDRFSSFPMDERYALAAARFIERSPVEAGMVRQAEDYRWSSAAAHVLGRSDPLVKGGGFLLESAGGPKAWRELLQAGIAEAESKAILSHESTGRPLGSADFVAAMEKKSGRKLAPGKRGPKRKEQFR